MGIELCERLTHDVRIVLDVKYYRRTVMCINSVPSKYSSCSTVLTLEAKSNG